MFRRFSTSFITGVTGGVAVAFAILVLAPASLAGQAQTSDARKPTTVKTDGAAAAARKFVPQRLPWGDPDISGNYTTKDEANTPFERPQEFAGKRLEDVTPAELAAEPTAR